MSIRSAKFSVHPDRSSIALETPSMLAHNVFFSLHDPSDAAVARMLAACRKYLTGHPGTVFFACGTPNQELKRPVNDRDFDIALLIVFDSQESHDAYQE